MKNILLPIVPLFPIASYSHAFFLYLSGVSTITMQNHFSISVTISSSHVLTKVFHEKPQP